MADRACSVGFLQACIEARGPPKLEGLPVVSYLAAPILSHMRKHGVPINMPYGMTDKELESAISYGSHSSSNKERSFVRRELAEQLQAGNIAIFPLAAIRHLNKLWLSPLAAIPQTGRKPRMIHKFSWRGLNKLTRAAALKDSVRFGKALHRLLD